MFIKDKCYFIYNVISGPLNFSIFSFNDLNLYIQSQVEEFQAINTEKTVFAQLLTDHASRIRI